MPKKAAFINGAFHEQRDACNAYVVFRSDDDAVIEAALAKNNQKVEDHHIRVDRAARTSESGSNKRSVFVGNLPFDVSEEECALPSLQAPSIAACLTVRLRAGPGYVPTLREQGLSVLRMCAWSVTRKPAWARASHSWRLQRKRQQ